MCDKNWVRHKSETLDNENSREFISVNFSVLLSKCEISLETDLSSVTFSFSLILSCLERFFFNISWDKIKISKFLLQRWKTKNMIFILVKKCKEKKSEVCLVILCNPFGIPSPPKNAMLELLIAFLEKKMTKYEIVPLLKFVCF